LTSLVRGHKIQPKGFDGQSSRRNRFSQTNTSNGSVLRGIPPQGRNPPLLFVRKEKLAPPPFGKSLFSSTTYVPSSHPLPAKSRTLAVRVPYNQDYLPCLMPSFK
jgi:hypothetical protein